MFTKLLYSAVFTVSLLPASILFDFEAPEYAGSAAGMSINGQDGWYRPDAVPFDGRIFTYSGNNAGFADNPAGGSQFAGTSGFRAQHHIDFSSAPLWDIAFDVAARIPSAEWAGRFSLLPDGGTASASVLGAWDSSDPNSTWTLGYTGQYISDAGRIIPGPAWSGLAQNHWYRSGLRVDMADGRVVSAWIEDPALGTHHDFTFSNLNLANAPDAIRLFGGNAWDNVSLQNAPEPATYLLFGCGIASFLLLRRRMGRQ